MTDTPLVDPGALARLDKLGGPGFALRIIGIFLAEGPRRIADAKAALARRHGADLAHAVHALISSSGNVGATGLVELVREMERDAEAGAWPVLPDKVALLEASFGRVVAQLEQYRGAAGA
jgi:HPt (histidine-containing phosphotransfer) domain-containing protein